LILFTISILLITSIHFPILLTTCTTEGHTLMSFKYQKNSSVQKHNRNIHA
jgi:hypothetical protein